MARTFYRKKKNGANISAATTLPPVNSLTSTTLTCRSYIKGANEWPVHICSRKKIAPTALPSVNGLTSNTPTPQVVVKMPTPLSTGTAQTVPQERFCPPSSLAIHHDGLNKAAITPLPSPHSLIPGLLRGAVAQGYDYLESRQISSWAHHMKTT